MSHNKRNPFQKAGILCLALVLGLGAIGVGYAHWTETLNIQGSVGTGIWETCETGFAWGGSYANDFSDYGFNNWGWTNGGLPGGEYKFFIYAAAGGGSGKLVGFLTVEYGCSTVVVTYNMYPGFTMTETHLHVGAEPFPRLNNGNYTVAPGQYPYKHDELGNVTTDSYTIAGLSGDIYVIGHAVVCGSF